MANLQDIISRPVIGKLKLSAILSIAGIIGPIVFIFAEIFTILTALSANYNVVYNSISSLVWSRFGFVQTIGFLVWGLFVELFAAGIFLTIKGKRGFGFSMAIFVFFGFCLLMVGAFHTDINAATRTVEGMIHGFSAKAIFWLFPAAAILIAPSLKADRNFTHLYLFSLISAGMALVLMLCIVTFAEKAGWFGLFERLLVADAILWVEVMAIFMLKSTLRTDKTV